MTGLPKGKWIFLFGILWWKFCARQYPVVESAEREREKAVMTGRNVTGEKRLKSDIIRLCFGNIYPKKKKKFICATQCVFFNLPSKLIIALWIKVFINCLNYPFYQMSPISLVKNCVFFLYLLSLLSQYHTLSFDLGYCRPSGDPFSWEWT